MKFKSTLVLPIVALIFILLACGRQTGTTTTNQPTGSTIVPSGPCYNVLYPFAEGYQWIYDITGETGESNQLGLTVEKVQGSQAKVNALDVSTGVVTETIAECEDGAIKNYPAIAQSMLIGNAVNSNITIQYISGIFAPAEDVFVTNDWLYTWTADYSATGNIQVQEDTGVTTITVQESPVHLTWETAGSGDVAFESVTVKAGTFEHTLKVVRTMQADITITSDNESANGTLTLHTTQWFEPYIGLVKSQIDSGDITSANKTFPLEITGTAELVEFRPGTP